MSAFVCCQLISEKTYTTVISSAKCQKNAILSVRVQLTPLGFLEEKKISLFRVNSVFGMHSLDYISCCSRHFQKFLEINITAGFGILENFFLSCIMF